MHVVSPAPGYVGVLQHVLPQGPCVSLLCVSAGVVAAVEGEFDALAAKKDMTRAGEEPRLRVARWVVQTHSLLHACMPVCCFCFA